LSGIEKEKRTTCSSWAESRKNYHLSNRNYHVNPSPKRSVKLVVFGRKMEPLGSVTVLDVLNVWNREYWSILW